MMYVKKLTMPRKQTASAD